MPLLKFFQARTESVLFSGQKIQAGARLEKPGGALFCKVAGLLHGQAWGQALAWVYREWSFQKSTVVSKPQRLWCLLSELGKRMG